VRQGPQEAQELRCLQRPTRRRDLPGRYRVPREGTTHVGLPGLAWKAPIIESRPLQPTARARDEPDPAWTVGDVDGDPEGDLAGDLEADSEGEGIPATTLQPPAGPAGESFERRQATVTGAQHGQRLDRLLVALAPEFSRSHLQQLIERGHVQVEGPGALQAARRMRAGERVTLELVPTDESRAFRPEPMALQLLFEDEHLLVLDKPVGLVVHPAPGHWSGTLLNGLLAHHAAAATLPRAGIVHRLDRDTSGVMAVGKSLPAVTALVRAIAARRVRRRYLALVHGEPPATAFTVDVPIGRDPRSRVRMAVVASAAGGREARTDFGVVATRAGFAALRCELHTGRTHQIRVHLASRGHPLVADALYGGRPALGLHRQALHAWRLELAHPVTGATLVFSCPVPEDFARAWAQVAGATMRGS
jgi:23S rRNA pseudouridine1911/1915/1917 synthase